jgi:ectoine hydroxylase-related dioxygenase (phytanoyl-CoA dioxygenase family)
MASQEQTVDLESWDRDGVLILRGFFNSDRLAAIDQCIESLWRDRAELRPPISIDVHINSADSARTLLSKTPDSAKQQPYKINDLYLDYPSIRLLALDPALCKVLDALLNGTPMLFNSLNFEYGSQQADHRDTLFMPPRVPNKMVVSWIALEPAGMHNGALRYYPGSHKIPPYYFSHGKQNAIDSEIPLFREYMKTEMNRRDIKAVIFNAKPGDVLIWHSELLHGGSEVKEPLTSRRSVVAHYYRRKEYYHRFWQVKKMHENGFYFKRAHPAVSAP